MPMTDRLSPSVRGILAEIISSFARAADCTLSAAAADYLWNEWIQKEAPERDGRPPGESVRARLRDEYGSEAYGLLLDTVELAAESRRSQTDQRQAGVEEVAEVLQMLSASQTRYCPIPP